jgi:PPM family protein phosphatase
MQRAVPSGRQFSSQSVGCRGEGEVSAAYADFVFGNLRYSLRVWMLSRQRSSLGADTIKRFVGEYIPYEQDLAVVLDNWKGLAARNEASLLFGDGHVLYVLLPPRHFAYIADSTGKIEEMGGEMLRAFRYNFALAPRNLYVVMTAERIRQPKTLLEVLEYAGASDDDPTKEVFDRLSLNGPLGVFSTKVENANLTQNGLLTLAHVSSNQGQVRQTNEDCGSVVSLSYANEQGNSRWMLGGVADGVGGLAAGEVASKVAISTGMAEIIHGLLTNGTPDPTAAAPIAFDVANDRIMKIASYTNKPLATTLSLAIMKGENVYAASVGDTRIYHVRPLENKITQLTVDHRLEQEGVRSHIITRSLGSRDHTSDVRGPYGWRAGDIVLTCSDGLHDLLSDGDILESALAGQTPKGICSGLTALANSRGGRDNITIAAVTSGAGKPVMRP